MLILFYDLAQCDKWTLTDSLESPKCLSYKESLDAISEESWVTLSDEKAYWADQGFFTLFFHTEICSTNLNEKPSYQKNQVVFHLESPKCFSYKESLDAISKESWVTHTDEKALFGANQVFLLYSFKHFISRLLYCKKSADYNQF